MESNVERETAEKEECVCKSGASLDILGEVHRAYEERMEQIERSGGGNKLQMQVHVLRSWVSDLVAQNTLLVRAVEQLERETAARITAERRRHAEVECEFRAETAALRRRLARKDSDLRGLIEVLRRLREQDCTLDGIHFFEVTQSDIFGSDDWLAKRLGQDQDRGDFTDELESNNNIERDNKILALSVVNESLQQDLATKDREIRRLNADLQQYEQAMARMKDEINPNVPKKDAEVMAGMCCTGTECGDLVPVQDIGELLQEETKKYKERIQKMEMNLKLSTVKMRAVHKINLGLIEELSTLRRFCVAIDVERRDARLKLDLEGQIVKQLVRQLRQAKEKLQHKGTDHPGIQSDTDFVSGDHNFRQLSHASVPIACTRQPRARRRDVPPPMEHETPDSSEDFRPTDGDRNTVLSRKSH